MNESLNQVYLEQLTRRLIFIILYNFNHKDNGQITYHRRNLLN